MYTIYICIFFIVIASSLQQYVCHNFNTECCFTQEIFVQPPYLAVLTYPHISRCKKRFLTLYQLQSLHTNSLKADAYYVQKIGLFYCIFITLQHVKVGVLYTPATWYLQEFFTTGPTYGKLYKNNAHNNKTINIKFNI